MSESRAQADFGYRRVKAGEKQGLVNQVFTSVAARYDLMNDLMSGGLHRVWKRYFVATAAIRPGMRVLDLAAGTGDITRLLASRVGETGRVVACDINPKMLASGRDRLLDAGSAGNMDFVLANAEQLPWPARHFDAVTMAFGLRNVTDKAAVLREMYRVLKPGGAAHILEFSHFKSDALRPVYDFYSFHVLPRLGKAVAGDAESYRYLAESIRKHPDQESLQTLMASSGLGCVRYRNLADGIVAVHMGYRL